MFGGFFNPESAFRMFLERFASAQGHEDLKGILSEFDFTPDDIAQLLPLLKMSVAFYEDKQANAPIDGEYYMVSNGH